MINNSHITIRIESTYHIVAFIVDCSYGCASPRPFEADGSSSAEEKTAGNGKFSQFYQESSVYEPYIKHYLNDPFPRRGEWYSDIP